MRRLVLLFLTFVWLALHRICIDRHRKGERKNQWVLHECTTSSICLVLQSEESSHEPLDVIRRQVRSSPVIITQTCREKRGVTLHLLCSELNSRFKWRLCFLSEMCGVPFPDQMGGCACLIPTQTAVFIKIKYLNQISRFCTCMCVCVCMCSSLWAVSHGFKQDRPKVDGGKLVRKNDKWEVNDSRTPREGVWFVSSRSCGQFNWKCHLFYGTKTIAQPFCNIFIE